jgi:hypothetical protein
LPSDLAPSPEAPLSPDIRRVAESLGRDPARIIRWVWSSVAVEPIHGVAKGAVATLDDRSGGPADQAALLVALLRSAGIPARFVWGEVEVSREYASRWLGFDAALDVLVNTQSADPADTVIPDASVSRATLRHVWVEFHAGDSIGWVPVDPSQKRTAPRPHPRLPEITDGDIERLTSASLATASVSDADGSVTGVDTRPVDAAIAEIASRIQPSVIDALVSAAKPPAIEPPEPATLDEIRGSFPHKDPRVLGRGSSLPDEWHIWVRIEWGEADIDIRLRGADIGDERVTLWWVPFSASDASRASHGLLGPEGGLVQLRRVLLVGGSARAAGSIPVLAGSLSRFALTFQHPSGASKRSEFAGGSEAGSVVSLVICWGAPPSGSVPRMAAQLGELQGRSGPQARVPAEAVLGILARAQGVGYWMALDILTCVATAGTGTVAVRMPSALLTGFEVQKNGTALGPLGFFVDIRLSSLVIAAPDADSAASMRLAIGIIGSALEGEIFTFLYHGRGVSTVDTILEANRARAPIYFVTRETAKRIFPRLALPPGTSRLAVDAVEQGLVAVIPSRPVKTETADVWGLWVINPETGAGAFWISDQLHGGFMAAVGPQAEKIFGVLTTGLSIYETATEIAGLAIPFDWAVEAVLLAPLALDVVKDLQGPGDAASKLERVGTDIAAVAVSRSVGNMVLRAVRPYVRKGMMSVRALAAGVIEGARSWTEGVVRRAAGALFNLR